MRNGRVPRYQEIADALRARIGARELPPGARLDNQRRLAADFGVTLMTLRQALEVLEREPRADRRVAAALGLAPGTRVVALERLRLVDGQPMSLQRSFLAATLGEAALRADLERTPLGQVLEFKLGVVIGRARETVSAVRLPRREARALGCRAGAPGFESERVSFDATGAPVVFDHVYIPGDRFRITRELRYAGAMA